MDDMKRYEIFASIKVDPPFIVRLDGWNFHALAKKLALKVPFDENFARALANTAAYLMKEFNAEVGYVFSDEINLLFKHAPFGRVEKIDSIFAGLASSKLTLELGCKHVVSMDCRIVKLPEEKIQEYFAWRQAECKRNHNNAYAYWLLRKQGLTPREAQHKLHGLNTEQLKELCKSYGIDLDKTPRWQREGIWIRWGSYEKEGYNPLLKRKEKATRRKLIIDFQR